MIRRALELVVSAAQAGIMVYGVILMALTLIAIAVVAVAIVWGLLTGLEP